MTKITFQDGKVVMRDGKIGTEQECCCGGCCSSVVWHRVHGECNNLPDDFTATDVGGDCYAYYTWEDWDCQNELAGRDCGDGGELAQCNIFARVKVTGSVTGTIEYLQSSDPDVWGPEPPGGFCGCPDSFGSLEVYCECVCPGDCVDGLQISLGNSPTCAGGFYSDSVPCNGGATSASMYCSDGKWIVSVSVCCFENDGTCFYSYAAELQCESDGLPPAGNVDLVEIFGFDGGGCPPLPPAVTIIK